MSDESRAKDGARTVAPVAGAQRKFFQVYKRGQGYYTRMGTVVGMVVIILAGMNYLWQQLEIMYDPGIAWTLWLRAGIPIFFGAVTGLFLFWFTGSNRKACDFLIATEGEMKKVSWSTRREVIGSTKVVILFTVSMAVILFAVDIAFLLFFGSIGVLKVRPETLRRIFGLE